MAEPEDELRPEIDLSKLVPVLPENRSPRHAQEHREIEVPLSIQVGDSVWRCAQDLHAWHGKYYYACLGIKMPESAMSLSRSPRSVQVHWVNVAKEVLKAANLSSWPA